MCDRSQKQIVAIFTGNLSGEFIRYFFIAVLSLAVDYSVFLITLNLVGVRWGVAATTGFICGALMCYAGSRGWVFSTRKYADSESVELSLFVGVGIAGLGLLHVIMWYGVEVIGFSPEVVRLVAAAFTFVFNFALRKFLLFKVGQG